jgi:branched-chain amino acid transport system substrate-binding protein
MSKKTALIFMFILALTFATGCGAVKAKPILIGVVLPEAEEFEDMREQAIRGIELAVDEINQDGGLLGKTVEIVLAEGQIDESGFSGVVGYIADNLTYNIALSCQQNGIPVVTAGSTDSAVTKIGDYIFAINTGYAGHGSQLAELLIDSNSAVTAVIYERSEYGRRVSDAFKEAYKARGGIISADESYIAEYDRDFSFIIDKIAGADIKTILLIGSLAEGADFLSKATELGKDGYLYETENNYTDGFDWSMYFYDAVKLLADAAVRAESVDGEPIRDALASTESFAGATGIVNFSGGAREPVNKDFDVFVMNI